MKSTVSFLEIIPVLSTFGTAIMSSVFRTKTRLIDVALFLLGFLFLFYTAIFFTETYASVNFDTPFDIRYNKISIFVGALYTGSLFIGLFPVRKTTDLNLNFLFYLAGGLGIVMANNLPTFFLFWIFHRALPLPEFIRQRTGGTYFFQHLITAFCFIALLILAYNQGLLFHPMTQFPPGFFTLPVLILAFVIIYQSHGIFPFHSWVHDVVGALPWYEFSALFLSRAGVLLFVQFLLPTLNQDPPFFQILLLSLSIVSSIFWSVRGLLEESVSRRVTYFYIAQTSLLLTGMQADLTAARGSYLHMMVISLSGTALFAILSHIQHTFSFKRASSFYGLAVYYPKLATLFCLFGLCMIGVPMGASFVVEDLVITGLLQYHQYLGLGHIFATCLNGILFFLLFTNIFWGPNPFKLKVSNLDMPLPQMASFLVALLIMILIGIVPSLFLEKITW